MHLKMCPYQEVECEVMGCGERFTREELDTHMERSTQKHITLMAAATQRMSRENTELHQESERKFQEKDEQIAGPVAPEKSRDSRSHSQDEQRE